MSAPRTIRRTHARYVPPVVRLASQARGKARDFVNALGAADASTPRAAEARAQLDLIERALADISKLIQISLDDLSCAREVRPSGSV